MKSYDLSVLMPVYNERHTLPALLDRVMAAPGSKQLIIVDDGSTDGTAEYLKSAVDGKCPDVKVLYHTRNQGKGAAIRSAIPLAEGCFSIVQDGDLEYDPQ
ncbi:MAG TPA: glycosyltransferase family 2 protein, partial [Chthonomonadales bacterium]|nr:glycosyltransferase family 2 protein [Chthonomonadales bacterium]